MICGETVHQGDCILSTTQELMTFTACGEVPNWQQARYPYSKDLEVCTNPNTCSIPSAIAAITTPLLADQWRRSSRTIHTDSLPAMVGMQELVRRNLVAQVKLALQQAELNSSHYAGHSFRIGATSTQQHPEVSTIV